MLGMYSLLFFFKQKTAYERRISDWSSDVCSSDLHFFDRRRAGAERGRKIGFVGADAHPLDGFDDRFHADLAGGADRHQVARLFEAPADCMLARAARAAAVEIGRASCRARGCPYG